MILSSLSKINPEKSSHDSVDKIQKKVFLKNGQIPHLTQFAQGNFQPGCLVPPHKHLDMWEIFLVENGEIEVAVNDKKIILKKGDFLTVEPHETHSLKNTSKFQTVITYFSIEQSHINPD